MSPKPVDPEYEMLRTEILQYMEEYQTVRNMMYIATASIFGLNGALWDNGYLFLLPLAVVLPCYLIYYDYWKCVCCAATYLQVFLECDSTHQPSYQWETRHRIFSLFVRERLERHNIRGIGHFQQIPYLVCGILCLILYYINLIGKYAKLSLQKAVNMRFLILDIILGVALTAISIYVFAKFWTLDSEEFILIWKEIKESESKNISH